MFGARDISTCDQFRNLERRIPRSDHPLGQKPASPFACVSTPKGEVAATGAGAKRLRDSRGRRGIKDKTARDGCWSFKLTIWWLYLSPIPTAAYRAPAGWRGKKHGLHGLRSAQS